MAHEIEGAGEAQDAAIDTSSSDAPADAGHISDSDRQVLVDNVDRAKAKVAQAEAHLDAANEALANAVAELEGN